MYSKISLIERRMTNLDVSNIATIYMAQELELIWGKKFILGEPLSTNHRLVGKRKEKLKNWRAIWK